MSIKGFVIGAAILLFAYMFTLVSFAISTTFEREEVKMPKRRKK